jgi:hypothetical protein
MNRAVLNASRVSKGFAGISSTMESSSAVASLVAWSTKLAASAPATLVQTASTSALWSIPKSTFKLTSPICSGRSKTVTSTVFSLEPAAAPSNSAQPPAK